MWASMNDHELCSDERRIKNYKVSNNLPVKRDFELKMLLILFVWFLIKMWLINHLDLLIGWDNHELHLYLNLVFFVLDFFDLWLIFDLNFDQELKL